MTSYQSRIIEEAKFTFSPLGKTLEKQKNRLKIKEQKKLGFRNFKSY